MEPQGFEKAWSNACRAPKRGTASAELKPLARRLYAETLRRPVDRAVLRGIIETILTFLAGPSGNTHANCYAMSVFLDVDDHWEGNWQDVPDDLFQILARMSAEMYQAVDDPEWTSNYGATPEQLLIKLRGVAG